MIPSPANPRKSTWTEQFDHLLCRFPPLDNKARFELFNSADVVADHLRVRRMPGGLGRVWKMITGEDVDRTNEVLGELAGSSRFLHQQINHLEAKSAYTHAGMERIMQECARLSDALAGLGEGESLVTRLNAVNTRLNQLHRRQDAHLVIQREEGKLKAGEYASLPVLLRLLLAAESIVWESGSAFQIDDHHLFGRAVDGLTDGIRSQVRLERKSLIPLNALFRECAGMADTGRDGLAVLTNYGAQASSIASLLLDVTYGDEALGAEEIDLLLAEAEMRYVLPLQDLVRLVLIEAHARLSTKPAVVDVETFVGELQAPASRVTTTKKPEPTCVPTPFEGVKIGLVLSGGGAKGAYLVGVLKAMAEYGIQPTAVAGTSIGALNAAIVASCGEVGKAATVMAEVWEVLAKKSPVCLNGRGLSVILASALVRVAGTLASPRAAPLVAKIARGAERFAESRGVDVSILRTEPITEILSSVIRLDQVADWLPMWVAAFRGSMSEAIWEAFKGYGLGMENKKSEFFKVQDHPDDVQALILASAALPVLYPRQSLGDSVFFDGGIGGGKHQQGNTPITPLIEHGCTHCIVTHLSNGSLWTRSAFADVEILEVRPSDFLAPEGGAKAMLNFSPDKIRHLTEMGYRDASRLFKDARDQMLLSQAGMRV